MNTSPATIEATRWRHRVLSLIAGAVSLGAGSAMADTDDASTRRARMEDELRAEASAAHAMRMTNLVVGAVTGVALLPTGIALETRSDEAADMIGLGMTVGGATQLALLPFSLLPSGIEGVYGRYRALRASGAPDDVLVRVAGEDWYRTAEATRSRRGTVGWTLFALGAASASTGLVLLLANSGIAGWDSRQQYSVGAVFAGAGVPLLTAGLRLLLQPSAEEASWELHAGAERNRLGQVHFGGVSASSVQGGMLAQAMIPF